ncbi:MAG: hypothetical protein AABX99_04270 [Nanoarchaeota archaeon]
MGNFWELSKQAVFAVMGGYVGAIFGVVSIGQMTMNVAFFLSFFYAIIVIGGIYLVDRFVFKIS